MVPEVRIAVSYHHDSTQVARQLQQQLLSGYDGYATNWKPAWGLLFATERYAADQLFNALRQQFADIPLYGGAVIGQITPQSTSFGGYGVQLILFPQEVDQPTALVASHLHLDPFGSGLELAAQWQGLSAEHRSGLLFFDLLGGGSPRQRVSGQSLINGLNQALYLQDEDALCGMAALANEELGCSWLACGETLEHNAALLLVLPEQLRVVYATSHGNRPISRQFEITGVNGNHIESIDQQPALELMQKLLGVDAENYHSQPYSRLLSLGQSLDQAPSQSQHSTIADSSELCEELYLSRSIAGLDCARQSIALFDDYLQVGDTFQFMCRDQQQINTSLQHQLDQLEQSELFSQALVGLYFNCAGRYSVNVSREQEDAKLLFKRWPQLPMCGSYIAGEVASVGSQLQSLNWSGVIALLCWQPNASCLDQAQEQEQAQETEQPAAAEEQQAEGSRVE